MHRTSTPCLIYCNSVLKHACSTPSVTFLVHLNVHRLAYNCAAKKLEWHIFVRENREHFLQHTVAHEVAHLIAYAVYGKGIRAHGPEWQLVMQEVYQLPPNRCHDYPVKRSVSTQYLYQCQCPNREAFALSGQRHARINKGMQYQCKSCRTTLIYTQRSVRR